MPPASAFPFNQLPHELQREIFVSAVWDDPRSQRSLVVVARKVRNWIQPFLYHMVTLNAADAALFIRTINSKPPEFFAAHVRCLCLSIAVSPEKANQIMGVCTGVVELALWVDFGGVLTPTGAAAYLSSLSLRRLSIEHTHLQNFFSAPRPMPPPWYSTLTHLEIVFWRHVKSPSIPGLEQLTSLTHMTLGLRHAKVQDRWLSAILASCPRLRILVLMAQEEDEVDDPFQRGACWIVTMQYPTAVVGNWEASFRGLPDNYTRAEEEIRLKQSSDNASGRR